MLSKYKSLRANKEGFTIIEVIIVLVIAAVIMLMVFLVVPQLQRNQRNTRRQNDARRVLTALTQYVANNSSYPTSNTAITDITGTLTDPSGTGYALTFTNSAASSANSINISQGFNCATSSTIQASSGKSAVTVWIEGTPAVYCVSD